MYATRLHQALGFAIRCRSRGGAARSAQCRDRRPAWRIWVAHALDGWWTAPTLNQTRTGGARHQAAAVDCISTIRHAGERCGARALVVHAVGVSDARVHDHLPSRCLRCGGALLQWRHVSLSQRATYLAHRRATKRPDGLAGMDSACRPGDALCARWHPHTALQLAPRAGDHRRVHQLDRRRELLRG